MPRKTLIFGVAMIAVLIVASGIGWTLFNSSQPTLAVSPSPSPSLAATLVATPAVSEKPSQSGTEEPTAAPVSQTQVRDGVLAFIANNHNETAPYMQSFMWTGGRVDTGLVGAETYQYLSNGWNVTIHYPVVPNPVFTVTAEYISLISEVWPQKIIVEWQGTWQNGTVIETLYKFTP
jgi:hypothetical protein